MQIASSRPSRVTFVPHPRPAGVRMLCVLDAWTAARYAAAVGRVAAAVEASVGLEVVANRVRAVRAKPPEIVLRPWRAERRAFVSAARIIASAGLLLRTDVARFYGSVAAEAVADALSGSCGVAEADAEPCARLLAELKDHGVRGLPVGPTPSAVLANAALAGADEALRRARVPFVRWVDDWWISVRSETHAAAVLGALGDALHVCGLRLNDAKTRLGPVSEAGGVSPTAAQYHRAGDAHPVPVLTGPHALVPPGRAMGARR